MSRPREDRRQDGGIRLEELRPAVREAVLHHLRPVARRWIDPEDVGQVVLVELAGQVPDWPADLAPDEVRRRVWRTTGLRVRDTWRRHRELVGESAAPAGHRHVVEENTGAVTSDDELRWLQALVAQLPHRYAEVVRLCALEGHTPEAVARRLGLTRDTVYKRYEKARAALRRRFGPPSRG
jgi:RNA polymerase sigma factor (sigma-70 family)